MKNTRSAVCRLLICCIIAIFPFSAFAQVDLGALDLFAPIQKSCYSNAETVTVRIKNHSGTVHNFAAAPVTVNVSVAGPGATTFNPVLVNTGTLNPGDTLKVVVSNNYNMTASGTYTFNASITVAGDINSSNNSMPASSFTAAGPQIISTVPATRCGPGTVSLVATASAGSTVQWSTAAQGGTIVGTGTSFTTPVLTTTTTYYASSLIAGTSSEVGIKVNEFAICGFPTSNTSADQPLRFTTNKAVILNSAWIIPAANSVTLALRQQNSTVNIATQTVNFTGAQLGNPQQVNLNWSVAVPGNYQITNVSGGLWKITGMGCGYPFVSPGGALTITGSAISSTAISNTSFYNGFYQLNFSEGCQSTPVAVVATINDVTAITQQPQANISTCVGAPINLSVAAQGVNLVYQWRKNGINITNSNNDTLVINSASAADAGTYDVVITGVCGAAVTSNASTLNVASGNTWLGNVSSDWNTPANWCAGVPSSSSNVTVFAGTVFQPMINSGIVDVRSLTIAPGATMTLADNTTLNIHGDFVNSGTFNAAAASVIFKGTLNQVVGNLTAGNIDVNGSGITLNAAMTVNQALTLTNGNITLGNHNLTVNRSVAGSLNSHIITNGAGSVISRNISTAPVTIPVGPDANSYNPVIISNGGSRDYTVRVSSGLNPSIANPGRAVNRTWHISPNTAPGGPATITLQYADAHMNAQGVATNNMEVGVHNGTAWAVASTNVTPSGTSSSRQVVVNTNQFGAVVVTNVGGISWITSVPSTIDQSLSSAMLLPNIVESSAVLRVRSTGSAKCKWLVIDVQGRVMMSFEKFLLQGQNDIHLQLQQLSPGIYTLHGLSERGSTTVLEFVKR